MLCNVIHKTTVGELSFYYYQASAEVNLLGKISCVTYIMDLTQSTEQIECNLLNEKVN